MKSGITLYQVLHGGICGLVAVLVSIAIYGGGHPNPVMPLLMMTYFIIGNAQYGPGRLQSGADLKTALFTSVVWPFLVWMKFDERLKHPTSTTYHVFINDVCVGALSDSEYSVIRRQVLRDPRIYVAQLLNTGWIIFKTLDYFVIGVPLLAFWSMLGFAYFEPTWYGNVIAVIQQGPDVIREVVEKYVSFLLQIWVVALMVDTAIRGGVVLGFQNKFKQAITRLLRQHLKVAAIGDLTLIVSAVEITAIKDIQA